MLDFYMMSKLINKLLFYTSIYKREVKIRGEKSIIDKILVENNKRHVLMNTKVKSGPEIGSTII